MSQINTVTSKNKLFSFTLIILFHGFRIIIPAFFLQCLIFSISVLLPHRILTENIKSIFFQQALFFGITILGHLPRVKLFDLTIILTTIQIIINNQILHFEMRSFSIGHHFPLPLNDSLTHLPISIVLYASSILSSSPPTSGDPLKLVFSSIDLPYKDFSINSRIYSFIS